MQNIKQISAILNIGEAVIKNYTERNWIIPSIVEENFIYDEIDVARIKLIYELESELNVTHDSMDIVINLLDQIYGLRSYVKKLAKAIEKQPKNVQAEIFCHLNEEEYDK